MTARKYNYLANFDSIKDIQFEGKSLTFDLDKKDKTIMQLQVATAVTGDVGDKEITLIMKDDSKVAYIIKGSRPKILAVLALVVWE